MNLEKFTDRAKGFLQSAQTVAIRMNHQRISPEHLLKALLEDEQGMASGLIKAAGGDAATAVRETDAALAKVPAVSGSGAQQAPGLDNDLVRVLDQAEQFETQALGRRQDGGAAAALGDPAQQGVFLRTERGGGGRSRGTIALGHEAGGSTGPTATRLPGWPEPHQDGRWSISRASASITASVS